ncbi:MAG: hypothetical protein M3257_06875 [Actinomycetota bacterium]|nr:hypothetical protein [Actinomycetota bacterium]
MRGATRPEGKVNGVGQAGGVELRGLAGTTRLTDRASGRCDDAAGTLNTSDEVAGVIALLLTDDAATITGRVIDTEAGFRRWKM